MNEPESLSDDSVGRKTSDHDLVVQLQAGDELAATTLYQRYAEQLRALAAADQPLAFACRLDPEDIVQSVFRTFFRRVLIDYYDVPPGEDLWQLFLVIGLNKIRNVGKFHRAQKRDAFRTVHIGTDSEVHGAGATPSSVDWATLKQVIDEMLMGLPETFGAVVQLRIEGYDVGEIAKRLGRAKRSVERILQEFRQQLRVLLDEDDTRTE